MFLPDPALRDERLHPRLWQHAYLSLRPLLSGLSKFADDIAREKARKILDLGCGIKPYEPLFSFTEHYVGFDVQPHPKVDVVGFNWELPFADDAFDALLCTQVLEHTARMTETAKEIRRVVRPGGLVYVSVPLTFPEHGVPYDFYRLTRYGLREVFRDFEVVSLTAHNGYIATMFRLWNAFLSYLPGSQYYFAPLFLVNNALALLADFAARVVGRMPVARVRQAYDTLYMGMTESYSLVLRVRK
jgi:SAM-dependent methyltransferase